MVGSNREWRAESLGAEHELALQQGTVRYFSVGSGPAIVFVHGALVNANLWRKVVAELSADFRCVTLDLPFGSHVVPMPPGADLSPPAVADLIADAIEALELDDVTLVANDTGGAISQLVVTRRRHGAEASRREGGPQQRGVREQRHDRLHQLRREVVEGVAGGQH